MGRATKAQALEHRGNAVRAASRLFRERGVQEVPVADVMAEVGLTQGGFYRHFKSKEHLLAEATERAFDEMMALLETFDAAESGDHLKARVALISHYLSEAQRDNLRDGCPAAGFAIDIGRRAREGSPANAPYARGVEAFARWISESGEQCDLAVISTMVGALILSRATAGTELSARILEEAKKSLGEGSA